MRYGGGVTWDFGSRYRLGVVYRHEPSFPVTVTAGERPGRAIATDCGARFHIPDVYGTGISVRPTSFLTVNADYNRVLLFRATRDFVTSTREGGCITEARAKNFVTRDGSEYHAGVRYVAARATPLLERHPLIVTAGWWPGAHALEHRRSRSILPA